MCLWADSIVFTANRVLCHSTATAWAVSFHQSSKQQVVVVDDGEVEPMDSEEVAKNLTCEIGKPLTEEEFKKLRASERSTVMPVSASPNGNINVDMKTNTTEQTTIGDTDLFLLSDTTGENIKYIS